MNVQAFYRRLIALVVLGVACALVPRGAHAQLADLADVPLANSPSTSVLPNLMYVLDDSGSMNYNYMPDQVFRTSAQVVYYHCRRCTLTSISNLNTSTNTITSGTHNGRARAQVMFTSGTPPNGLSLYTTYYVRSTGLTTTQFQLETAAGAAIDITGSNGQTGAVFSMCTGQGAGDDIGPFGGQPCGNEGTDPNAAVGANTDPQYGDPLFYAPAFNKIWYNPDITYSPAVDSTGASLGASTPTAAKRDAYTDPSTVNLTSQFQELVFCNTNTPTASDLTNTGKCRYNGRHNAGAFLGGGAPTYFLYYNQTFANSTGSNQGFPAREFVFRKIVSNSVPHYYNITPQEYCSDSQLVNCALATSAGAAPDAANSIAAPVRWCKTLDDAQALTVVSGNSGSPATPRCRKKFDKNTHPYPRLGRFARVDITSGNTFPKGPNSTRTDCAAAASCTYAEELQNFANWFSYYRIRLSLMKTATGKAFTSVDDRFRVGFITINPNNPVTASKFLGVAKFDSGQRSSFYTKLYAQTTNGSTPLREALSRIGRYYAGVTGGINSGMGADPMTHSCQTNYALLTTDGYWNGNSGDNLAGSTIGNQDNSDSGFTLRSDGAYDGNRSGAGDTLADVAAYYYKTDLRTAGVLSPNNVPTSPKDSNNAQHMVTFTLGLGLEGFMDYQPDYDTSSTGDFARIKAGSSGCPWASGVCDWPVPAQNDPSTLDDLWHAAVNGRGKYFSAGDPNSLALGLQSALATLRVQTAAASASATSSPNITQTDNFIYSTTFRTGIWDGEIVARRIDAVTGNVLPTIIWSAQAQLDGQTTDMGDARTIFTIQTGGGRKDFKFANLSNSVQSGIAPEQPYFANKCGAFAQCTLLTTTQQAAANSGDNLVNYLRGQRQFESFTLPETIATYRTREHVLGDPVNGTPAFVRFPLFEFGDAVLPDYATFKSNVTALNRPPMLYIAANDGFLHAFNGDNGMEQWAYLPRIVMPELHKLANANWNATHRFLTDGSPQVMDIYVPSQNNWKTIMVAGLNSGGRGFYALDITDPSPGSVRVLWEICSDSTLCQINDPDLGFSFGNPVISKRASDGRWVVFITSGINNVSPGSGQGYLYTLDAYTGQILSKVSTGFGSTTAPSGLTRIAGFADDFAIDNTAKTIYGGDLWGNVWRFDTSTATPTRSQLAQLKDNAGKPQSITTRPELGVINGFPVVFVGTGRYIGEDDLVDPATLVPAQPFAYQQSLYAIKDRGVFYPNFRAASVVTNTIIDGGTTRSTTNNTVNWALQDGWYVDFNPGNTSPGERVNLDPQLVQGILIVTTNVPNNSACTVGGDSWLYFFDYKNGKYVSTSANGVVAQKRTGEITVGIVVVRLPSGSLKVIATGATGRMDTLSPPPADIAMPGRRVSWRELFQK